MTLAGAGFCSNSVNLTPYRGVTYHLKEWSRGNDRPTNKEELFNLRHASLRNCIERIFGILKKRFPILVTMPSFKYRTQCDLVLCCMIIHNYIRFYQSNRDEYDEAELNEDFENSNLRESEAGDIGKHQRDVIASALWNQYQDNI